MAAVAVRSSSRQRPSRGGRRYDKADHAEEIPLPPRSSSRRGSTKDRESATTCSEGGSRPSSKETLRHSLAEKPTPSTKPPMVLSGFGRQMSDPSSAEDNGPASIGRLDGSLQLWPVGSGDCRVVAKSLLRSLKPLIWLCSIGDEEQQVFFPLQTYTTFTACCRLLGGWVATPCWLKLAVSEGRMLQPLVRLQRGLDISFELHFDKSLESESGGSPDATAVAIAYRAAEEEGIPIKWTEAEGRLFFGVEVGARFQKNAAEDGPAIGGGAVVASAEKKVPGAEVSAGLASGLLHASFWLPIFWGGLLPSGGPLGPQEGHRVRPGPLGPQEGHRVRPGAQTVGTADDDTQLVQDPAGDYSTSHSSATGHAAPTEPAAGTKADTDAREKFAKLLNLHLLPREPGGAQTVGTADDDTQLVQERATALPSLGSAAGEMEALVPPARLTRQLSFVAHTIDDVDHIIQSEREGGVEWFRAFWHVVLVQTPACRMLTNRSLPNWVAIYNRWQATAKSNGGTPVDVMSASELQDWLAAPPTRVVEIVRLFDPKGYARFSLMKTSSEHSKIRLPVLPLVCACVMISQTLTNRQKLRFLFGIFDKEDKGGLTEEEFISMVQSLLRGLACSFGIAIAKEMLPTPSKIHEVAKQIFGRIRERAPPGEASTSFLSNAALDHWILGHTFDPVALPFALFLERFSIDDDAVDPDLFQDEPKRFRLSHTKPVENPRLGVIRYLETVWPRSYWNTGPVRFEPRCYRSSLPPRTGKSRRPARVRTAWEDDMKPKSEAGAVSTRVGAATVVPLETDTQSESSSSKDSQEEAATMGLRTKELQNTGCSERDAVLTAREIFQYCQSISDFKLSHEEVERGVQKPISVEMWCGKLSRALEEMDSQRGTQVRSDLVGFLRKLCPKAAPAHIRMYQSWLQEFDSGVELKKALDLGHTMLQTFQSYSEKPVMTDRIRNELDANFGKINRVQHDRITTADLKAAMEVGTRTAKSMMQYFDTNRDGFVDKDEYAAAMCPTDYRFRPVGAFVDEVFGVLIANEVAKLEQHVAEIDRLFAPRRSGEHQRKRKKLFIKEQVPERLWQTWNEVFDLLDPDDKGTVGRLRLKQSRCLCPDVCDYVFDLIAEHGKREDGKDETFNRDQFLAKLLDASDFRRTAG
ncbi:hypothetical protein AK812_SmicGene8540 [Symbiodinium microadriaticum]|uniref:EF-hand domain-containing protein n=1 Tax=Symbiodinium microadriaticum TaxID=2951 RepID=A0A1Q9EKV1_SYMMI|nr:hypothetical protein AK812_SmicGene8540 [Symbiodinium microadriaticum]